jgi:hypothetical protein
MECVKDIVDEHKRRGSAAADHLLLDARRVSGADLLPLARFFDVDTHTAPYPIRYATMTTPVAPPPPWYPEPGAPPAVV